MTGLTSATSSVVQQLSQLGNSTMLSEAASTAGQAILDSAPQLALVAATGLAVSVGCVATVIYAKTEKYEEQTQQFLNGERFSRPLGPIGGRINQFLAMTTHRLNRMPEDQMPKGMSSFLADRSEQLQTANKILFC